MASDIPERLDRLPWSRWHLRVIVALGITWALDGLEASLIANLAPTLTRADTLALRPAQVSQATAVYLLGQVFGALLFGWLTDRHGRKALFLVTLGLYLGATALGGLAPNFVVFATLRFCAGAGIGGEYSAINSAIDEIVPARLRGQVDLGINGTYWIGVLLGALLTTVVADTRLIPPALGWRVAFGLGAVLGLSILLVRRHVPESPRWLLLHGRRAEAEQVMTEIERAVYTHPPPPPAPPMRADATHTTEVGPRALLRTLFVRHPRRTALGLCLMIAQAFFYNTIFFSYGLILQRFHGVAEHRIGLYMTPFAVFNFAGPLVLGPLFDRWGRRTMIPLTYAASALTLAVTGVLFMRGGLEAISQTACWCAVFFFASSAASSAYLTVSELFPVEIRGLAIAVFYAIATLTASLGPLAIGEVLEHSADAARGLFLTYLVAAAAMAVAALIARWLGVPAEGRSLEQLR